MKRPLRSLSAAFTLLEIMLVVMIIALLAGAAIYMMGGNLDIAKDVRVNADLNAVKTQLMIYQTLNGQLPSTSQGLKALVAKPEGEPAPRSWRSQMPSVPVDPWGKEYQYVRPGVKDPGGYDIFSAGPDGIPGNQDDRAAASK